MNNDGTNSGYDLEMTQMVKDKVTIPVIASSGAGKVEHFSEVWELPVKSHKKSPYARKLYFSARSLFASLCMLKATDVEAALAAGIFHRKEVPISAVKKHLQEEGIEIR